MDKKLLIGIGAVVLVLVLAALAILGLYNDLVSSQLNADEKWANVQAQYQRRVDLIPNLVNTVKGSANFEASTLEEVTRLRSQWQTASNQQQQVQTANQLESALSKLLLISENYPDLKTTQAFQDLTVQLEGTENRVAFARDQYNESVKQYNGMVRGFPGNFLAGMFGFQPKEFFQATTPGAENAPAVNFG